MLQYDRLLCFSRAFRNIPIPLREQSCNKFTYRSLPSSYRSPPACMLCVFTVFQGLLDMFLSPNLSFSLLHFSPPLDCILLTTVDMLIDLALVPSFCHYCMSPHHCPSPAWLGTWWWVPLMHNIPNVSNSWCGWLQLRVWRHYYTFSLGFCIARWDADSSWKIG